MFPDTRDVLFTLAAAGLFGGVLTYYLSPDRHAATVISESLYAAVASNGVALTDALKLDTNPIYIPVDTASEVHLYVPDRSEYRIPEEPSVPGFTEDDYSGLVLTPTGRGLFQEFECILPSDLPTAPEPLAVALSEGLVEGLELAGRADPEVDVATGRATIGISDGLFGPLVQFDHPIASFLGIGFAIGLDRPVVLTVASGSDRTEWLVTCRWETDA
ncbi:hypothetical protein [Halomontanus rarus]|uniref:hypothetical protein n=1 Tax=Halomontanus rarus TaxID=3034020 RepID=UPI001F60AF88